MPNLKSKLLILATLAILVSGIGETYAKNYSKNYSKSYGHSHASDSKWNKSSYNNAPKYAQNKFRSRSEVMNEVKQNYNAKVLKISLNEQAGVYNVRILMPNGKVRSIKVNAR